MSQEENTGASLNWLLHLSWTHWAGAVGAGVLAEENTNKLTEPAVIAMSKMADLFIGIYSSLWGKTKIILKSYSPK